MRALWLGRFQPPTIAHWAALLKIQEKCSLVTIAVVYDDDTPVPWGWMDKNEHQKNAFSPLQVKAMWRKALLSFGVNGVDVISIPRPFAFDFGVRFPEKRFQLVSTNLDSRKAEFLKRSVVYVKPPWELHVSEIKEIVKGNMDQWGKFVAPGIFPLFKKFGGLDKLCPS